MVGVAMLLSISLSLDLSVSPGRTHTHLYICVHMYMCYAGLVEMGSMVIHADVMCSCTGLSRT